MTAPEVKLIGLPRTRGGSPVRRHVHRHLCAVPVALAGGRGRNTVFRPPSDRQKLVIGLCENMMIIITKTHHRPVRERTPR